MSQRPAALPAELLQCRCGGKLFFVALEGGKARQLVCCACLVARNLRPS